MSKTLMRDQRLIGFMRVLVVVLSVCALTCMVFAKTTLADIKDGALFRVGVSRSTIGSVNENDAIALIRVWAQAIIEETNIAADPQPQIFEDCVEMKRALILKKIEGINVTTVEYFSLQHLMEKDDIVASVIDGSIDEEYVVLVNRKKYFKKLDDLQGRHLRWGQSVRNSLALIWLDTALVGRGFNASTDFFETISKRDKISEVILPVFFGKVDACIATRSAFELMVELNPQIGKQLRVLATSPPFVPVIFGFRVNLSSPEKDKVMKALVKWTRSRTGRQILTMFQTDSVEIRPISCLGDTLALLREHQRLFGSI